MGRTPFSKPKEHKNSMGVKKGPWSVEEDQKLIAYIRRYGIWNWTQMAKPAGLTRSGKSCRLRWVNYLRPNIKHGNFSKEEEEVIIKWQQLLGNRWSAIAKKLQGRTDNEIKNYWNTRLKKRMRSENSVLAPSTSDGDSPLPVSPSPNNTSMKIGHFNILESLSEEATPDPSRSAAETETSGNSSPVDWVDNEVRSSDDAGRSIFRGAAEGPRSDFWEEIILSPLDEEVEAMFMVSSMLEQPPDYSLPESSANGYLIYDNLWES